MQQAREVGGGAPRGCRLPEQLEPVSAQASWGRTAATCFAAAKSASKVGWTQAEVVVLPVAGSTITYAQALSGISLCGIPVQGTPPL